MSLKRSCLQQIERLCYIPQRNAKYFFFQKHRKLHGNILTRNVCVCLYFCVSVSICACVCVCVCVCVSELRGEVSRCRARCSQQVGLWLQQVKCCLLSQRTVQGRREKSRDRVHE